MRIIIEIDPDNKAEIKKGSTNDFEQVVASTSTATANDAGGARIPEPEVFPSFPASTSLESRQPTKQPDEGKAIDAGSFKSSESKGENSNTSNSQNELAAAATSGLATDAGAPRHFPGGSNNEETSPQEGNLAIDKSNAIDGGGFQGATEIDNQ